MDKTVAIISFCTIVVHSTFTQPLAFEPQEEEAHNLGLQIFSKMIFCSALN